MAAAHSRPQHATIRQRKIELKGVQKCLRELPVDASDVVEQSLARYLTIRAAGYIEAVRDDLADLYASSTGHPRLGRRIAHHLRTGQGVNPTQLLTFVGSFDPAWQQNLKEVLDADEELLKSQLGALVAARKKVAHGDGEQVTTAKALSWTDAALKVGDELAKLFDPNTNASV